MAAVSHLESATRFWSYERVPYTQSTRRFVFFDERNEAYKIAGFPNKERCPSILPVSWFETLVFLLVFSNITADIDRPHTTIPEFARPRSNITTHPPRIHLLHHASTYQHITQHRLRLCFCLYHDYSVKCEGQRRRAKHKVTQSLFFSCRRKHNKICGSLVALRRRYEMYAPPSLRQKKDVA